ncbi:hypothetical protein KIH74_15210 [Kineosporia sp. J2-2]|uniref:Beta-ketoacyl-[acyl-carrier-protein] synthase III C-terminal domain-containing protein n=1 Tax=Kineosporia corallincola TaxID=2835133 RepID=A0ABS5TL21_9ACTN|nr:3-oxoacyl-[acyl-carrier-protein] synthase III C-terminal domain-containing protein [Kineosporia corallincola]MBT0770289.1 hypothetical protein [Kineosporia corallincola]
MESSRWALKDLAPRVGLTRVDAGVFRSVQGLRTIPWSPTGNTLELIEPPVRAVLARNPEADVRHVLYAHTMPSTTPDDLNPATYIRDIVGNQATATNIGQQACVSGLAALEVADLLLATDDSKDAGHALIVTGERAYHSDIQITRGTHVMGEAGAAVLVRRSDERSIAKPVLVSQAARTFGRYSSGLRMNAQELEQFGTELTGLQVDVMHEALSLAGATFDDIELIVPHNVNVPTWQAVTERLGKPKDFVYLENIPRYSHCFSSDIFLNLRDIHDTLTLRPDRLYLLAAVGIGSTVGAAVLRGGRWG